jgi:hypothetical protein
MRTDGFLLPGYSGRDMKLTTNHQLLLKSRIGWSIYTFTPPNGQLYLVPTWNALCTPYLGPYMPRLFVSRLSSYVKALLVCHVYSSYMITRFASSVTVPTRQDSLHVMLRRGNTLCISYLGSYVPRPCVSLISIPTWQDSVYPIVLPMYQDSLHVLS